MPTLALDPAPAASLWHGLSIGSEIVAVSGPGGGVGGDVFAGYERAFSNGVIVGARWATGTLPGGASLGAIARRFDFATADVTVGYDLGRLTPFVTAGITAARPRFGAGSAAGDALNRVINAAGDTRTLTAVGAGVHYAVTSDLSVEIAVGGVQGPAPGWP